MDSSSRISLSLQQSGIGRGERCGSSVSDNRDQHQHRCVSSFDMEFGRPILFFSRKLHPAETKYSTFDNELLAMYMAVKKFRYITEGRKFSIFTAHKPLTFVFNKVSISAQHVNSDISVFYRNSLKIHATFVDNVVADALS